LPVPGFGDTSRGAGPVAQLDRALPSEGKGHAFESRRVRQFSQENQRVEEFIFSELEMDFSHGSTTEAGAAKAPNSGN
jgi:hypothetical protein